MSTVVFINEDCDNCELVEAALKEVGAEYTTHLAKEALDPSKPGYMTKYPNWRELGFADALAIYQIDEEIPIVSFNGIVCTFRESIERIKKMAPVSRIVAFDRATVECTDGACALAV